MLGLRKHTPIVFFLFALILLFLPDRWVSQPELLLLTFLKPVNYLMAGSADDTNLKQLVPSKAGPDSSSLSPQDKIKALEKKVSNLTAELQQVYNENHRLAKQLQEIDKLSQTQPDVLNLQQHYQLIIANVLIQRDLSGWRQGLVIDRGSNNGITAGLSVVSGKYLVGKISSVGPFTSQVALVTDPSFRVKAHAAAPPPIMSELPKSTSLNSSADKQAILTPAEGVLEGFSTHQTSLKWVSRDVPVQPGWLVFTSSDFYKVWPRGLLIGTVKTVEEEGYFARLKVEPVIDINNLDSVIVLKKK
ncbi:MAG: rod shape-determining protein MreC [Planctomycetota bacterium]